jgi:hypothetical protein
MSKNFTLLIILIVLTVVSGVAYYMSDGNSTLSNNPLANFAIEDVESIDKLIIVDKDGKKVTLTKTADSDLWDLNGKYKARKSNIDLLLKTFQRIKVKSPVPKSMQETVIRNIAGDGKKCEIYQNGVLLKTYYVGTPTPDHFGTYMLLETPSEGRSSEPFIMHMTGFAGFLSTRFFTDEEEWRHTGIFNYPELEFSSVEVDNYEYPNMNFRIDYGGGNDLKLISPASDQEVPVFDTTAVKNYLLHYKKVHFETFNSFLSPAEEDSVLRTTPAYSIKVTENDGTEKQVLLYWVQNTVNSYDTDGKEYKWHPDIFYGTLDGEDLVRCQRFVFDPLLQPIIFFTGQRPQYEAPAATGEPQEILVID